jgi:hypothetical protein
MFFRRIFSQNLAAMSSKIFRASRARAALALSKERRRAALLAASPPRRALEAKRVWSNGLTRLHGHVTDGSA